MFTYCSKNYFKFYYASEAGSRWAFEFFNRTVVAKMLKKIIKISKSGSINFQHTDALLHQMTALLSKNLKF